MRLACAPLFAVHVGQDVIHNLKKFAADALAGVAATHDAGGALAALARPLLDSLLPLYLDRAG